MKYVALFRGLNVGGKNTVKMTNLKTLLNNIGCRDVQSYIQSGNVVLDADTGAEALRSSIQAAFARAFGFESTVALRTQAEWTAILAGLPFSKEALDAATAASLDVEHLYVYLAEDALDHAAIEALKAGHSSGDKVCSRNREIYLLCEGSVRNSKLAASLSKLQIPLTARNWKTVKKLQAMLEN